MDYDHQISQLRERVKGLRKAAALLHQEIESIEAYMDTLRRWDDEAVSRKKKDLEKAAAEAEKKASESPGAK